MSDPTQFIVSLPTVHALLKHQGIIGVGYDSITDNKCSLHQYTDQYKRTYVTQHFDSIDSDFVSNKLNSIAKYSHSLFISNIVRPAFMSTRKTQKTAYELVIFYDTTGLGELSLQQLIKAKKQQNQRFQAQEIISFFWQIADFLMMCVKNNTEYLNLNPLNILCKIDGLYGYNFFITNFGKKYRNTKKVYFNPKDRFYNGTKTAETLLSAAMFTFGMVLLQMSSLLQLNEIFQYNEINEKLLIKRIEAIKITNDKMMSKIIKSLLQLDQTKRLKPNDIYTNAQWLKLRKVAYFSSKIDFFGHKNFQGVIQYDKKTSIGEALDSNLCMIRGTFINGIFEGRGVRQRNDMLQLGIFLNNELIQGQVIKKNSYFDIGKYKKGIIYQGMRIYLNISNLTKEVKSLIGFLGQFQQGQPKKGEFHYSDGFVQYK